MSHPDYNFYYKPGTDNTLGLAIIAKKTLLVFEEKIDDDNI